MRRTILVALSAAGAVVAGAAAGLLVASDEARAGDTTAERGPYGPGSGVTPPAAQGTGTGAGSANPRERQETTTSGAEASKGKPLVPGTGVGRLVDGDDAARDDGARKDRTNGRDDRADRDRARTR